PAPIRMAAPAPAVDRLAEITGFITGWIAQRCRIPREAAGLDTEFAMLGLGSIDSSELAEGLSDRFAADLDPTVLWNYPNTRELAAFIHRKFPERPKGAALAETSSWNALNTSAGASLC
ncbi:acyl carrier protein, partial [Ramlibacter sp.]|uniref:acyl carrier protein n=1 Tax=Ramlibacter sp. TaxID=1917967 RepID=UPI001855BF78